MRALAVLISFLCFTANAQVKANMWFFGNNAGLNFSTGQAVPVLSGQLSTLEGCSTLSDSNGNLLLYTNGATVWNKQHQVMVNGTGLYGDLSSSQAVAIVPKPGSDVEFFIFTTNASNSAQSGFRYSLVNLNMNSGAGAIVEKNVLLYSPTCEKMSVVKHANGIDYWVVTHVYGSNEFKSFKIDASGIGAEVSSSAGIPVSMEDDTANAIGYMKISPDGTKLIACHTYLKKAELFEFDRSSGIISGGSMVSDAGMHVYGAEFSSDSKLLYISAVDEKKIWQYDLDAANIALSEVHLATLPNFPGALQMAPDGRIYIAMAETDRLSVIRKPELKGADCELTENAVDLAGRVCMLGLPGFEATLFANYIDATETCSGDPTSLSISTGQQIDTVTWNFGDGQTANGTNVSHTYALPGEYVVSATASNSASTITKFKKVKINTTPVAHSPGITNICVVAGELYPLTGFTDQILNGQSINDVSVSYFATGADAQALSNPISVIAVPDGVSTVYAVAQSVSGGCSSTVQFTLNGIPQPVAYQATDFVICENFPYDGIETFDLSTKNDEILNGQDPSLVSITYHLNAEEAESGTNAIPTLFDNSTADQTIYARVFNNFCHAVTSFALKVISTPKPATITDLAICDSGPWDGFATFDLSVKKTEILGGLPAVDYNITFHKTSQDAELGTQALSDSYSNITLSQTIFARISHISGNCPVVYQMQLIVLDCNPAPELPPYSFMKFFTPNGDGANDTWKVTTRTGKQLLVSIFDRNGKLVKMISGNGHGWDGTLNGEPLPANDYWFIASGADEEMRGHFSLMR